LGGFFILGGKEVERIGENVFELHGLSCIIHRVNAFKHFAFLLSWFLVKTHAKRKKSFINLRSANALRYK
jgi:hypothetical protein